MTKKQQAMVDSYRKATATSLREVYFSWSMKKEQAFDRCRAIQYELSGHDGRICSANSYQFTYAFLYEKDGKQYMCYRTATNDYRFCIEEDRND